MPHHTTPHNAVLAQMGLLVCHHMHILGVIVKEFLFFCMCNLGEACENRVNMIPMESQMSAHGHAGTRAPQLTMWTECTMACT